MSSQSVLYPPNASHLTSEVIRNVTERSTPKFDGVGMTASHSVLHVHGLSTTVSTTISSPQYVRLTDSHAPVRSTPQAVALAGAPSAPGGFLPAVGCTTTTAGLPTTSTRPQAASAQAKDEDAATIEARRQRHRVHQERYRRKLRLNLQEHQQSIQDLHEEIQWLELQRQITALYASMVWSVTAEYYRPFRVGLKEPEFMTSDMRFIGSEVQAQRSFVRAVIAPDVLYGTVQGVDALLENWRYLSLGFKGAVAVMNAVLDWPAGFLPDKKSPSVKT